MLVSVSWRCFGAQPFRKALVSRAAERGLASRQDSIVHGSPPHAGQNHAHNAHARPPPSCLTRPLCAAAVRRQADPRHQLPDRLVAVPPTSWATAFAGPPDQLPPAVCRTLSSTLQRMYAGHLAIASHALPNFSASAKALPSTVHGALPPPTPSCPHLYLTQLGSPPHSIPVATFLSCLGFVNTSQSRVLGPLPHSPSPLPDRSPPRLSYNTSFGNHRQVWRNKTWEHRRRDCLQWMAMKLSSNSMVTTRAQTASHGDTQTKPSPLNTRYPCVIAQTTPRDHLPIQINPMACPSRNPSEAGRYVVNAGSH